MYSLEVTNVYRDSARYIIIPLGVMIVLAGLVYYTISRDLIALGFTAIGLTWVNHAYGTMVSVDDHTISVKAPLSRRSSAPIGAIVGIETATLSWNFNRIVRFQLTGDRKLDLPPGMAWFGVPEYHRQVARDVVGRLGQRGVVVDLPSEIRY